MAGLPRGRGRAVPAAGGALRGLPGRDAGLRGEGPHRAPAAAAEAEARARYE